ncbi:hypothetical protein GH714_035818 [Hevea brasiliensis]|uniref:Retrovirus-related Pol polyprotein from transposon TNT 1-94-like beta-barrel domain-containing protein n=1 Tax=Hevea brasiliensis TaxID=3981 RepID=A0A6A6KYK3_HEVBR|nr:hypothetical protein GH714_035818 [Hevea brasiliensis]
MGHYAFECTNAPTAFKDERAYCTTDEGDEESTLLLTYNAGGEKDQEAWFLDSGASNHMTGKKNLFVTLDESVKSNISFGDNTKVAIEGRGDILIQTKMGHISSFPSDSDWEGDIDDRKSTTGFLFFIGQAAFTWSSKKQPTVTLSTCEAEYVVAASCVCHAIWLRKLLQMLPIHSRPICIMDALFTYEQTGPDRTSLNFVRTQQSRTPSIPMFAPFGRHSIDIPSSSTFNAPSEDVSAIYFAPQQYGLGHTALPFEVGVPLSENNRDTEHQLAKPHMDLNQDNAPPQRDDCRR